jgi:hypothetical protein
MARKNIHQSKRIKSHKAAAAKPTVKPVTPAVPVTAGASATPLTAATAIVRPAGSKAAAAQEPASVRFAELPYELRRIGLFTAFVVVLLIVLWLFLK